MEEGGEEGVPLPGFYKEALYFNAYCMCVGVVPMCLLVNGRAGEKKKRWS